MKKLLSILGIISLITSGSSNFIGCKNNKEQKEDRVSSNEVNYKQPEKPPESSNWKLINIISKKNFENELSNFNDKWYIVIFKPLDKRNYIVKFNSKWDVLSPSGNISFQNYYINFEYIKSLYLWDGIGDPNTPIIDSQTGKIINWK